MRRKFISLVLACSLCVSLAGCNRKEKQGEIDKDSVELLETPNAGTQSDIYAEENANPVPADPDQINPLTGKAEQQKVRTLRPVAVMLNNIKAAQPQLGNAQADIIYEVPAEGGITRMLAIYQSLDGVGNLGSIRSTRPYYIELALGHDAILVHAGASTEAYNNIRSWKVNNIDGVNGSKSASNCFWRDAERRKNQGYEHSMLTSGENIQNFLDASSFRREISDEKYAALNFADDNEVLTDGTAAKHIQVKLSSYKTGTFDYQARTGLYRVGQYGEDYIDGNTGETIFVKNILVLETSMKILDKDGRLRVNLTGSGKGYCYSNGRTQDIQWHKDDRNSPLTYTTDDDNPLLLGRGVTYVCVIDPKTGEVHVSD